MAFFFVAVHPVPILLAITGGILYITVKRPEVVCALKCLPDNCLERCPSGLRSRFRKPVYPFGVPRVRIPPSPFFVLRRVWPQAGFGIGCSEKLFACGKKSVCR